MDDDPDPADPLPASLAQRWPLDGAGDLRADLTAAYADPGRGHHGVRHLLEVLDHLDEIAASGEGFDPLSVRLAAWFHDAVYDGERDAEERSATWAEESLVGLVDDACLAEVARLVRLTEHHRPEPGDSAGAALSDADLAILAAPAERYAAYVAAVRREYAHLDDTTFAEGRAAVLSKLCDAPTLFATAYGLATWEQAARANVDAELASLAAVDA